MNTAVMFSSKDQTLTTPQSLYDELHKEFNFCGDLAASKENAKHTNYFDEAQNALIQNWKGLSTTGRWLWCNPPYKTSKLWIEKAYKEMCLGTKIVMLLPSRTDTKAFHKYIYNKPGVEIRFLAGRLKFGNCKNTAPFPSMVVVFDGYKYKESLNV